MDINCIIDWEAHNSLKKTKKIKYLKNVDIIYDIDFRMDQMLILAFCNPKKTENIYMDLYEKIYTINKKNYGLYEINFKEDWNLLMYAIECVKNIGYNNIDSLVESKIENVYNDVLEFCKNYVKTFKDKLNENG